MKYLNNYKDGKLSDSTIYPTMEDAINALNRIVSTFEMAGLTFNKVSDTEWVRNNRTFKIEDKSNISFFVCGLWEAVSANYDANYLPYEFVGRYLFNKVLANTNPLDFEKKICEFAELYYENPKERARIKWEIQTSIYKK